MRRGCIVWESSLNLSSENPEAAEQRWPGVRLLVLVTGLTLIAFAANSVLTRAALAPTEDGTRLIDPVGFTWIRLASGAFVLFCLVAFRSGPSEIRRSGSWISAAALATYAVAFSWAYLSLSAGTGALILFGAVQATMIGWGIYRGERPLGLEWIGLAMAILGLVILVFPGLSSPSPIGAMLMAVAGIAWGVYSLRGRGQARPIEATAGNFVRSLPFVTLIALLAWARLDGTPKGIVLAVISGAITSGLGYVLWYTALRGLTATRAALLQLSVPVIAALGGVSLLGEALSAGLIISTLLVVGGLALAIASKSMRKKSA